MLKLRCPTPYYGFSPIRTLVHRLHKQGGMKELKKPLKITNVLVFKDFFMKHIIAYITLHQTAENCCQVAVPKVHPNYGSSGQASQWLGSELWGHSNIQAVQSSWIRTLPYQAQTNGQVEHTHHTSMQEIGKLARTRGWMAQQLMGDGTSLQLHKLPNVQGMTQDVNLAVRGAKRHECINEYITDPWDYLRGPQGSHRPIHDRGSMIETVLWQMN